MDGKLVACQIKDTVSALEAGRVYGLEPNRSGFCRCPFHGEKTASLKLYDGSRGWHCFGCHACGSVIDLVMRLFELNFMDACRKLVTDFSLAVEIDRPLTMREKKRAIRENRERIEAERLQAEREETWSLWAGIYHAVSGLVFDNAPKQPDDDWNDAFCVGLASKTYAKFMAEESEWAMLSR